MQSRGSPYTSVTEDKVRLNPDMYIITIGISAYKGDQLKLELHQKMRQIFFRTYFFCKKITQHRREAACDYLCFQYRKKQFPLALKMEIAKAIDSILRRQRRMISWWLFLQVMAY